MITVCCRMGLFVNPYSKSALVFQIAYLTLLYTSCGRKVSKTRMPLISMPTGSTDFHITEGEGKNKSAYPTEACLLINLLETCSLWTFQYLQTVININIYHQKFSETREVFYHFL